MRFWMMAGDILWDAWVLLFKSIFVVMTFIGIFLPFTTMEVLFGAWIAVFWSLAAIAIFAAWLFRKISYYPPSMPVPHASRAYWEDTQ
ncbi:MAG: hypothetical protein AB7Q00_14575 [Phycisphaerales bacterium]